jgi:hypothetical protein
MIIEINNKKIEYTYSKDNVHIQDSFAITSKEEMMTILNAIRVEAAKNDYFYDRDNKSWLTEWRAHNRLYNWGFIEEKTGSVDLSESESKIRLFLYSILAIGY